MNAMKHTEGREISTMGYCRHYPTLLLVPESVSLAIRQEKETEEEALNCQKLDKEALLLIQEKAEAEAPDTINQYVPHTVPVFQEAACLKALEAIKHEERSPKIAMTLEQALKHGGFRPLLTRKIDDTLVDFDALEVEMPNFSEALDMLRGELLIATRQPPEEFRIEPLLLDGPPGIGKTRFARAVARILNVGFSNVSLGTVTGGFELAGLSQGWGTSRPGRIASVLADTPLSACPVLLLDEIDKINGDFRHDPTPVLLDLLERDSARRFRDECLGVEIDASRMIIFATSNDKSLLSDPLLTRLRVVDCKEPSLEERRGMAERIVANYATTTDIYFAADALTQIVVDATNMREIARRLREEIGRALRRDEGNVVYPRHVRDNEKPRQAMGFV
ncbi:MAG TPA: ATP-binding protein [Aestuariivirga sp.]|nr:ATP-binding protein [Aestuariivirga sp.]